MLGRTETCPSRASTNLEFVTIVAGTADAAHEAVREGPARRQHLPMLLVVDGERGLEAAAAVGFIMKTKTTVI